MFNTSCIILFLLFSFNPCACELHSPNRLSCTCSCVFLQLLSSLRCVGRQELCGDFVMDGTMYLWLFSAPMCVRMPVFWMLVFARMNVAHLNQPPHFPHAGSWHVQAARFLRDQRCGEVRPVFHRPLTSVTFTYMRDQLLAVSPSPLHPGVVKAIRGVGIGYHLPRVRTHHAGRRKQRKISVVVGGDFVGKSNKASRIVNFKNLIRVPITRFDSVHSTDLSVALFNAQSVGHE